MKPRFSEDGAAAGSGLVIPDLNLSLLNDVFFAGHMGGDLADAAGVTGSLERKLGNQYYIKKHGRLWAAVGREGMHSTLKADTVPELQTLGAVSFHLLLTGLVVSTDLDTICGTRGDPASSLESQNSLSVWFAGDTYKEWVGFHELSTGSNKQTNTGIPALSGTYAVSLLTSAPDAGKQTLSVVINGALVGTKDTTSLPTGGTLARLCLGNTYTNGCTNMFCGSFHATSNDSLSEAIAAHEDWGMASW